MPTQKPFHEYDQRLVDLLDRAVKAPVRLRRKFDNASAARAFSYHIFNVRRAARMAGNVKPEWEQLTTKVYGTDLVIGTKTEILGRPPAEIDTDE